MNGSSLLQDSAISRHLLLDSYLGGGNEDAAFYPRMVAGRTSEIRATTVAVVCVLGGTADFDAVVGVAGGDSRRAPGPPETAAANELWNFVDESKPGAPVVKGELVVAAEQAPTAVAARFAISSTMQALALQLNDAELAGLPLFEVDELGYCTRAWMMAYVLMR